MIRVQDQKYRFIQLKTRHIYFFVTLKFLNYLWHSILFYISFRCAAQCLVNHIIFSAPTPIFPVPIWHHTQLLQHHWLYSLYCYLHPRDCSVKNLGKFKRETYHRPCIKYLWLMLCRKTSLWKSWQERKATIVDIASTDISYVMSLEKQETKQNNDQFGTWRYCSFLNKLHI